MYAGRQGIRCLSYATLHSSPKPSVALGVISAKLPGLLGAVAVFDAVVAGQVGGSLRRGESRSGSECVD